MNVIDSNILRSGIPAESRCAPFLIPLWATLPIHHTVIAGGCACLEGATGLICNQPRRQDAVAPADVGDVEYSRELARIMQRPAQPATSQQAIASTIVAGSAAAGAAVLLLGALALWAHYGTAVFFEMLASGIAACF